MYGSEIERLILKIPVLYQAHCMARKLVLSKEETLSQMLIMLSKEYLNVQSELIKIKEKEVKPWVTF